MIWVLGTATVIHEEVIMLTPEEIQLQRSSLVAYRQMLNVYLKQQAQHSKVFAWPAVEAGISESREQIRIIKVRLRQSGVSIANHPDDEESTTALVGGKLYSHLLFIARTLLHLAGLH